ncbi:MAG: response regulator [bacterium]|nr:response regulator [bacterium]
MKKVLLVDDDAAFLESLKDGLEQYADGIGYLVAADGEDALRVLENEKVVTLVTDLKMPRLDGYGLITRVLEQNPEIPCIVMTAHGSSELERTFDAYSIEYVEKPIDLDQLHRLIIKTVRHWGEQGQLRGANLPSFVQMVELERKSCRVEVCRSFGGDRGVLCFTEGRLLDAELCHLPPKEAALEILGWQEVYLRIGTQRSRCRPRISTPLMELMMEAARLADEKNRHERPESGFDALDDSLCEAEPKGPPEPRGAGREDADRGEVPRIVLEDGAMRGLNELLEKFDGLSGSDSVAVYSPGGELRGFFVPVPHLARMVRRQE